MRRVSIQKVIMNEDRSYVSLGRAYEGWEDGEPTMGKQYKIICESGAILKTSDVVRVNNGYIETMNSFYKLNVLEEEPFDLIGEEEDTGKTQEIILKKGY